MIDWRRSFILEGTRPEGQAPMRRPNKREERLHVLLVNGSITVTDYQFHVFYHCGCELSFNDNGKVIKASLCEEHALEYKETYNSLRKYMVGVS